ncbi:hypothetical protein ACTWM0_17425 [Pseudomonas machongensis]
MIRDELNSYFPPLARKALTPLVIAGMVTPVRDADGGINCKLLTQFEEGLLVAIDPYLGMQLKDRLEVLWDGVSLADHEVQPDELNDRIFLFLDTTLMQTGWVEKVICRLTRAGSPPEDFEDSPPLRLRIKRELPGGHDQNPALPGHSQLPAPLPPQEIIDGGVDARWTERGVPLAIGWYDYRSAWDSIRLFWGGRAIPPHELTEEQAAGRDPITITVDKATILAVGDSAKLLLEYDVTDEVGNVSEKRSLQRYVRVDSSITRLTPPVVKEARDGKVDLGMLGDKDATVEFEARSPVFTFGDTVIISWAIQQNGVPAHEKAQLIDNLPYKYEVSIPNRIVREGANRDVIVSYTLHPANNDPVSPSWPTSVFIVGDAKTSSAPTTQK